MQEIKKRRIVIASVLKPVDDTRMLEKLGRSLADTQKFEVFIIGFPTRSVLTLEEGITLLPLPFFSRLSLTRALIPLKILRKCIQVKPDMVIVNSHELLIVGILNRIFFGSLIIYDIRENYFRNILLTDAFPKFLRWPLALFVRLKERCFSPFFHHHFLAEKGYLKELTFVKNKSTVLENKVRVPPSFQRAPKPGRIRLVFTGTLAESTGVFQAIELAQQLHQKNEAIELMIVGYCAQPETFNRLIQAIENQPFIGLKSGQELVPHSQIFEAIAEADFGIIYYPPSPHTANSIPTKLYEYLGCRLPILLQDYEPWVELCKPYHAAVVVNFSHPDLDLIQGAMKESHFYDQAPAGVTWTDEEPKLLEVVEKLLK
ncbi:MAG: glycosyltransferase [Cyclobacteriaceae bacterium]|jgi:glycosyltransferase involved in cell wall biosynthesis|nr:glycosyltransferase [Flammeovirgaceae bacterium]